MIHGREILLSLCLMRVQNAYCVWISTFSLVGLGNFLIKFYGINKLMSLDVISIFSSQELLGLFS